MSETVDNAVLTEGPGSGEGEGAPIKGRKGDLSDIPLQPLIAGHAAAISSGKRFSQWTRTRSGNINLGQISMSRSRLSNSI